LLKNNLKLYFVGYKKILIGAGETESAKDIEVEIIDLESSSSNCSNLKDFPKATHGAISGLDFNDNPVICGGYGNRYKQECFKKLLRRQTKRPLGCIITHNNFF